MATSCSWQIDGATARLQTPTLSGVLDLDQPTRGLVELAYAGNPIEGHLWGWRATDRARSQQPAEGEPPRQKLRDAYVRGDDLIVTYAPTDACPCETQLYWQATKTSSATAQLSLLVSIRTHLLDTQPVVHLHSHRQAVTEQTCSDSSLAFADPTDTNTVSVLQKIADDSLTLIEACHHEDHTQLLTAEQHGSTDWQLFDHFLEKGVIRRARLTLAIANEMDRLTTAVEEFFAQPPPLTT